MGFPLFRVTLSNDIEGTLVISEPGGWDDAKMKLERNAEYHSLVEFYDQPLTFYGEDMSENGGIQYIRNIEQTQGVDAQIGILVELSKDEGDTWEQVVNNILSVDTVKETDFYLLEMGVLRNDFWQKFMNRKATPVDLASAVDLDGESRILINAITVFFTSQTVEKNTVFSGSIEDEWTFPEEGASLNAYSNLGLELIQDEIEDVFNVLFSLAQAPSTVINTIEVKEYGNLIVTVSGGMKFQATVTGASVDSITGNLIFRVNSEGAVTVGTGTLALSPAENPIDYTIQVAGTYTFTNLVPGDLIFVYGQWNIELDGDPVTTEATLGFVDMIVSLRQDTTYPETNSEGFLIHEAGNSITDRIIGRDGTFYSEYLGNQNTQIQNYDADGCGSNYALTRGLNIRGYSLAEKPFFISFDTWWNGINPLLNLGLGYETLPDSPETEVLRIEPKSYFYDKSSTSVDFDFVNNIERSYDLDYIFKAIEIGFEKWSAESASGVDDPQTKRVYNTRFKTVGKEIRILSKFIGASLAIEQTRRNRVEQGKDWRLDEDVMIIAVDPDGSPEYQPELDENFSSVTGLLNADTRYNIRLSVARNFERWKSFFNGCLQWYVSNSPEEEYKFASGEGNFDMVTTIDENDCEGGGTSPEPALSEKQNIDVTDDFLFMPVAYKFEHPLEWEEYKAIRDNRHKSIGVSRTDSDHVKCFIMTLEYQITRGKGIFTVVLGENESLVNDWILQAGVWDDGLYWRDGKLWID